MGVSAWNGGRPVQQLVQNGAQGIHVDGWADRFRLAGGLFGGQVAGRSQDFAAPGLAAITFQELGQAEVGNLGLVAFPGNGPIVCATLRQALSRSEEDVGGLEIAVDDAVFVRMLHGAG